MTRQGPTQQHAQGPTPAGTDKTVRRRVLHWLHQQPQPQAAAAATPVAALEQATAKVASAHGTTVTNAEMHWTTGEPSPAAPQHGSRKERVLVVAVDDAGSLHTGPDRRKLGARKKAVQLWKKWKATMSVSASKSFVDARTSSNKKLSPSLLQQHQQLQYSVDSSSIGPTAPTALYGAISSAGQKLPTSLEVGSASATGGTGADSIGRATSLTRASMAAAAAGMPGNVVCAFQSSLYDPATTPQTQLRAAPSKSVNDPHTVGEGGRAGAAAEQWVRACSEGNGSVAAAAWAAALGQPAATAAAAAGMRLLPQVSAGSSSSGVLSPKTPTTVSTTSVLQLNDSSTLVQHAAFAGGRSGVQEYTAVGQQRVAKPQPAAYTDSRPGVLPAPQPAPASARLLGTALTAYPAVAAELARSCMGIDDSVHCVVRSAAGAGCSRASSKSSAASGPVGSTAVHSPALVSSYSSFASSSAAAAPPSSATAVVPSVDVSGWLLCTALLEDELQGRALEVQEVMQQLSDRREDLQAMLSKMSGGKAAQRHQATLELSSISSSIKELTCRAAALGSALGVLQGCQTVLASSRGARLDQASKVAVLQLVMSEVVARLPDEGLQQLEVCQGLLGVAGPHGPDTPRSDAARSGDPRLAGSKGVRLGQAGREVCRLAGVGADRLASARSVSSTATSDIFIPSRRTRHLQAADDVAAAVLAAGGRGCVNDTCDTVCYDEDQQQQQQQLRLEQQHWHRYNEADDSSDDGAAEDDDVITTLSSVLSSRHYTPRRSLSYETRKAALAAARAGPWANAASAPSAPWAGCKPPLPQPPATPAPLTESSGRPPRGPHEGSFEVSVLNSGRVMGPTRYSWPHQQQAKVQPSAQGVLQSAGSGGSGHASSLEALLASVPVSIPRRTVHMSVPLTPSRACSSVMSDFDDSSTMFTATSCLEGWEGRLEAWPEEEPDSESGAAAGISDVTALEQQLALLQQGEGIACGLEAGSISRSSNVSCVTAISQTDEGEEDSGENIGLYGSGGLAAKHEAVTQGTGQITMTTAAASNSTASPPAGYPLQQGSLVSDLRNRTAAAGLGSASSGLTASVESAPIHQLLSDGAAGVHIDLNRITVGELLHALTLAVVQRQQQ